MNGAIDVPRPARIEGTRHPKAGSVDEVDAYAEACVRRVESTQVSAEIFFGPAERSAGFTDP